MAKKISQSLCSMIIVSLCLMTGCTVHTVNLSPEPLVSAEEFNVAGSSKAQADQ